MSPVLDILEAVDILLRALENSQRFAGLVEQEGGVSDADLEHEDALTQESLDKLQQRIMDIKTERSESQQSTQGDGR